MHACNLNAYDKIHVFDRSYGNLLTSKQDVSILIRSLRKLQQQQKLPASISLTQLES